MIVNTRSNTAFKIFPKIQIKWMFESESDCRNILKTTNEICIGDKDADPSHNECSTQHSDAERYYFMSLI